MLMFPINYIYITQLFEKNKHNGLDLRGKNRGEAIPIYSPENGTIIETRNNYQTQDSSGNSYGNYIKIDHGNGIKTLLAHLKYNSVLVKVGDKVTRGQKLATMGTTGNSTGIHVHYEVFLNNVKVDPLLYTYAYNNQVVDESSERYVKRLTYITPQKRNENIDQVLVNAKNLSIREGAGLEYKRVGFVEKGKYYNFTETKVKDNYTWYKIGGASWIANDGTYLTILKKSESEKNNTTIDEIPKEKENDEYKFIYNVTKTSTYLIDLKEGETLYIK